MMHRRHPGVYRSNNLQGYDGGEAVYSDVEGDPQEKLSADFNAIWEVSKITPRTVLKISGSLEIFTLQ